MAGFSDVLGHVAGGFEQARQIDEQRQFEDQQALRQQHLQLLGKLASDESLHPDLRNWAMQEGLKGLQQQPGKKWQPNWKTMPAPPAGGGRQIQQPTQSFTPTPMPTPPAGSGIGSTGPTLPTPPGAGTATLTPPPVPEYSGYIKTPQTQATEAAQATGAVTGAKATAELGAFQQAYEKVAQQHPDWSAGQIMVSLGKSLPYSMVMGGMAGEKVPNTAGEARNDPEWAHLVPGNLQDTDTVFLQRTRDGRPMTVTGGIVSGTLPKTTSKSGSTTTPGGMTTTRGEQTTVTPVLPGGKPIPKPPSSSVGGSATGKPIAQVDERRPDVLAAKDSIRMFGLPSTKMTDAQSIAFQQLKKEGWDPVPAGSPQARGRADSARSVLPLIEKARQLIAANPDALGPVTGRWSLLQNKVGNLSGPAKELAGTLTSIYSLAGSMHGWRAIKVADEFEKTYGRLSSDAASLNAGLDAMQDTAQVVEHIGYPGMTEPPTPPAATSTGKKQAYRVGDKWFDAATHTEIK